MKQKAGVPRPTPAEQEKNWKFVSMSSVRDGDSSKLNENLPAITEPWEQGMGFKRAHFNGRALNPPGTSMSFSFHAVPFPLHESPAYSLSSSSVKIKWPQVHHKSCDLLIPTFLQVNSNLKFGSNSCHFREMCERSQTVSLTTVYEV